MTKRAARPAKGRPEVLSIPEDSRRVAGEIILTW
jgi:hypothetical protein